MVEEGQIFPIEYHSEMEAWICPVCGYPERTDYTFSDQSYCSNCGSSFEAFGVQKIVSIGDRTGKSDYKDISEDVREKGDVGS